jgi:arylsulfatase A-like enzyme
MASVKMIRYLILLVSISYQVAIQASDRPNILWLTSDDNGCELGCYGDTFATTPNLDQLAKNSLRFNNVWSNAPVCAPARTALIAGMWPPSLGASHMRSAVNLPDRIRLLPTILREAGYYCCNREKEDYNVITPHQVWDDSSGKAHWRNRKADQPFFAVFNAHASHESQLRKRPHKQVHHPAEVKVPGYHPDLPEIRTDWAQYYDQLTEMDSYLGIFLRQLAEDGLLESTIIIYLGDHGSGMPRGKRWLYESGLKVPLLVSIPEKFRHLAGESYQHGESSDQLVSFLDLAPTMLHLCGLAIPADMDGKSIFAEQSAAPKYVFGFRDRMDERYDCSRAIRNERFSYIRNFMPHRPQGQYLDYMYQTPTTRAWLEAAKAGKTTESQSAFWKLKPFEELYDLKNDPDQLINLASSEEYRGVKAELKNALHDWLISQHDLGLIPEAVMIAQSASIDQQPIDWSATFIDSDYAKVVDAAFEATDLAIPMQRERIDAKLEVISYWYAIGLAYRSMQSGQLDDEVIGLTKLHKSKLVRGIAFETIARVETGPERKSAIEQLWKLAIDPSTTHFERMHLLDNFVAMNLQSDEIPTDLETALGEVTKNIPARYREYPARCLSDIIALAKEPSLMTPISMP